MARGLKQITKTIKNSNAASSLALLERCRKNDLIPIGPRPKLSRNVKMEKTWKALLADPPVSYSDPNQWRKSADVRPSSFPFCPRRYVMERLGLRMPSDFAVESNYYTEIGKAVHYVIQNAFARTGRLWGFWLCARPTCQDRIQGKPLSSVPGFYPTDKRCPTCKADRFEYEELVISDPKIGLRGHTDGVIVFKTFSVVLEVKTAGDDKVEKLLSMTDEEVSAAFESETPWYGYWHQAASYASLLRLKYPSLPPIKRVDYFIASRDSPGKVASFSLPVPEDNSWWGEIRCRILMAQKARDLQILPRGFASNEADIASLPTCRWCSHKEVCLKPEGNVAYTSDALYDTAAHSNLEDILTQERAAWAALFAET